MTQTSIYVSGTLQGCLGGLPIAMSGASTPSIAATAIRIASLGVTLCSAHHAKRCPDKLPGRNVIRSGMFVMSTILPRSVRSVFLVHSRPSAFSSSWCGVTHGIRQRPARPAREGRGYGQWFPCVRNEGCVVRCCRREPEGCSPTPEGFPVRFGSRRLLRCIHLLLRRVSLTWRCSLWCVAGRKRWLLLGSPAEFVRSLQGCLNVPNPNLVEVKAV
jgi:hypothetical protein